MRLKAPDKLLFLSTNLDKTVTLSLEDFESAQGVIKLMIL